MRKTEPCPTCGSARSAKRTDGACSDAYACNSRVCAKRKQDSDRVRGDRGQCHATTGTTSVYFCTLHNGHDGSHLNGTREWEGDCEAPIAKALRAHRVAS